MQTPKKALRITGWIVGIIAGLVIVAVIGLNVLIGWGVRSELRKATTKYGGDRIEALMAVVDCDVCRIYDRNQAAWALGQLRDQRALPVLYKYHTGKPCNHSRQICQYELNKAIKWTEGNSLMLPRLWLPMI